MNPSAPLVTVGMGVFNGENFVEAALRSILDQSCDDLEVIVSDNASTDRTQEICRDLAAGDERLRYLRQPRNLGAAPNHNLIPPLARGRYLKWASHDDVLAPTFLERCVAELERDPGLVLCHTRTRIIDADGATLKDVDEELVVDAATPCGRYRQFLRFYRLPMECNDVFGVIRREALTGSQLFGSYPASDMILLGELALRGRFAQVPEFLFLRRDHPGTSVRANREWDRRAAWFDVRNEGRHPLPWLRWAGEYLDRAVRVPRAWPEKRRCLGEALRWGWIHRRILAHEVTMIPMWARRQVRPRRA